VNRRLGASSCTGVDVETDDEDVLSCLDEAIGEYNRYRPQHANQAIPITSAQKKYGPIDHAGIAGITRVQFVNATVHTGDIDPFNPYSYRFGQLLGSGDTYGAFAQQLDYLEQARQVTSSEPEFHVEWERDNKLYLFLDVSPNVNYLCSYTYTWHVTPDNDKDTGMQFVPNGDVDWILQFVTALVKQILGRIRGKYHGVNMPDGSVEDNDYAELQEEGRTDQEKLIEEIKLRMVPINPIIG
jgi:hypothetical protein